MSREVPDGWAKVQMGDVCRKAASTVQVSSRKEYGLLGVRWYGNGSHLHSQVSGSTLKTKLLNQVRSTQIVYNKMWVSKGAFAVVPSDHDKLYATSEYPNFDLNREKIDPEFIEHCMRWDKFQSDARLLCKGSTSRARLNPSDFLTLEIWLPPLHEQRRIAEILSSVDEAIAATRAVIEQTKTVKQAVLERLLTRGIGHTRFKQTEIGEIPEAWDVADLFQILREPVRNGYSPISPPSPTGGWLLSLGSLSDDGLTGENLKPAPLDDPRIVAAKLTYDDVLISRSNTPDRVGMVGIYKGEPDNCFFPDLMICLRFNENLIIADFGALWLRHLKASGHFRRAAAGTSASMVKINRSILLRFELLFRRLESRRRSLEV